MSNIEHRLNIIEKRLKQLEGKPGEPGTLTVADLMNLETPEVVKIEGGQIGIVSIQGGGYWIELDRINTPRDLLEWVNHLLGKVWVTNEVLEQFIAAVFNYKDWELYKGV